VRPSKQADPKSISFSRPLPAGCSRMFSGFRSQWMMDASRSTTSASRIWAGVWGGDARGHQKPG
jgi:hypothetical protein